jgi:hypothetical protein
MTLERMANVLNTGAMLLRNLRSVSKYGDKTLARYARSQLSTSVPPLTPR